MCAEGSAQLRWHLFFYFKLIFIHVSVYLCEFMYFYVRTLPEVRRGDWTPWGWCSKWLQALSVDSGDWTQVFCKESALNHWTISLILPTTDKVLLSCSLSDFLVCGSTFYDDVEATLSVDFPAGVLMLIQFFLCITKNIQVCFPRCLIYSWTLHSHSQAWWYMSASQLIRRLNSEDCRFKA